MALITISGFPAAGKSTRANQIAAYLNDKIHQPDYHGPLKLVSIVSDHSLALSPDVYNGISFPFHPYLVLSLSSSESRSEKPARGTLFTAVQRQLSPDTILIVDSLNYIKGFRYQMYCAAREMKLRTCTVCVCAGYPRRLINVKKRSMWSQAPSVVEIGIPLEQIFMLIRRRR